MALTDEDVRSILQLLDASAFNELQIETSSFRLSLQRAGGGWTQDGAVLRTPALVQPVAVAQPQAASRPTTDTGASASDAGSIEVRTPLPGTFYRAPKPGSPPFVELGSQVEPDSVIAIVETMKLMNSVNAGARGQVVEICLADAQFADQGAVLMRIRPVNA